MKFTSFFRRRFAWIMSASVILFLSSNFVNAGNLLFNLVFSRWMGPELFSDLAFLLTLKLSILGVLNALQFLVTERTADSSKRELLGNIQSYRLINKVYVLGVFLLLPFLIGITIYTDLAGFFGLQDQYALLIFYFGIPFYLPLAIWRGVAQGRLDIWRMVASANVEMIVRFAGAALFWALGLGMSSIILAFVLSLFSAWWFALPQFPSKKINPARHQAALPWRGALPWACVQLAIVLALDGDVFVAKLAMDPTNAGYVAAISLTQRIIFFASFSLAAILLPQVIEDIKSGGNGILRSLPILILIAISVIPVLGALNFFPELSVSILYGEEFLPIAPLLSEAAISAAIITLNYFTTVFMMAHKQYKIGLFLLLLAFAQLVFLQGSLYIYSPKVEVLVQQKLYFQIISFIVITIAAVFSLQLRKPNFSRRSA